MDKGKRTGQKGETKELLSVRHSSQGSEHAAVPAFIPFAVYPLSSRSPSCRLTMTANWRLSTAWLQMSPVSPARETGFRLLECKGYTCNHCTMRNEMTYRRSTLFRKMKVANRQGSCRFVQSRNDFDSYWYLLGAAATRDKEGCESRYRAETAVRTASGHTGHKQSNLHSPRVLSLYCLVCTVVTLELACFFVLAPWRPRPQSAKVQTKRLNNKSNVWGRFCSLSPLLAGGPESVLYRYLQASQSVHDPSRSRIPRCLVKLVPKLPCAAAVQELFLSRSMVRFSLSPSPVTLALAQPAASFVSCSLVSGLTVQKSNENPGPWARQADIVRVVPG